MGEILSDERFLELFGNEPFKDFDPKWIDGNCIESAKAKYIGVRPLDLDYEKAMSIMSYMEDLGPLDYFGVLPAVLRAFTLDQLRELDIDEVGSFIWDLNPTDVDLKYLRKSLRTLKYGDEHVIYLIELLKEAKDRTQQEGIDPNSRRAVVGAIETFELVLRKRS